MNSLGKFAISILLCYVIYYTSKAKPKKSLKRKPLIHLGLGDDLINNLKELEKTPIREPPKDLAREMSLATYVTLSNLTAATKRLSHDDIELFTRRKSNWGWTYTYRIHPSSNEQIMRMCYMMQNTYRSAAYDIRSYFNLRLLYQDTVEYEVGYLTHEIIHQYQTLLELYYMVGRRFYYNWTQLAPLQYFFYVYQNVVFVAQIILRLCDMIHEVPVKYKGKNDGVFDDYHLPSTLSPEEEQAIAEKKKASNGTMELGDTVDFKEVQGKIDDMEKAAKRLRRQKAKQNKLRVMAILSQGLKDTEVKRQPKWGSFPNGPYGWSMEFDFYKKYG